MTLHRTPSGTTDTKLPDRRETWEAALALSSRPGLKTSLVGELAEYLGISEDEALERCRMGARRVSEKWRIEGPSSVEAVTDFYRKTDSYLYDLTWWHALVEDESALAGVSALEAARDHRCRTVLDFGSGTGSLGLLLARHGMDVVLADVNPALNDYARWRFEKRGIPVPETYATHERLPEAEFDFISAVDVLEHLPEPEVVLHSLATALKPGGTLFVHLPPEEDLSRPMHLWHGTKALLRHIGDAGLWLEKSDGSSLVLRRGGAPRYSLNEGIEVSTSGKGRVLLSERPLMATRLNNGAANLLERLGHGKSAAELSKESGLPLEYTTSFLDGLSGKRILLREREVVAPRLPTVTVVVPAKDRPAQTRACVEALVSQEYPPDRLEVIVVDDASDVPLADSLTDLPVRVIRSETNIGQSAARNLAAREAKGEVLAFTDNDCEAEPAWLETLVAHLCEPGTDVAGGRILSPPPVGAIAEFEAVRSSLDMGEAGSTVGPKEPVAYLPTCNLAADRETYLGLGGMDEEMSLGEDADFVWRAAASGSGVYYEPEAGVVHHHRTRLPELLRRRADYASSEADLQSRHPDTRRVMMVPVVGTAALVVPALLPLAWQASVALVLFALLALGIELAVKSRRLRLTGVRLPMWRVGAAVLRQHGAGLYHLGANVARYYSLPLLGASVFWPALLPSLFVLMAVPPVLDHRRLKPDLSVAGFVGLYWLELTAYQVGVWRGCFERHTLRPLLPKLRASR